MNEKINNTSEIKNPLITEFPKPTIFTPEQVALREAQKEGLPYDEGCFYMKDGTLDKEWINNMWYALRGKTWSLEYAKPEDIEIRDFGQFLYDHIQFDKIFGQSSGFKEMMSRPENDQKRQQVIDYISGMVNNTLSTNLRVKIDSVPRLTDKIKDYIKSEILMDVFFMNENQKWDKNVDKGEKEPEELIKFREMVNGTLAKQKEIRDLLVEKKLW